MPKRVNTACPSGSKRRAFSIGYTFKQKSRAYGICCTGEYRDGGLFYQFDDGEWQTESGYGNLCLEAVVKGNTLPKFDLSLDKVTMEPIYYIGDNITVNVRITNRATSSVKGITFHYDIPGVATDETHVECDLAPGEFSAMPVVFPPVSMSPVENTVMTVSIAGIDGGSDENPDNNSQSVTFSSADNTFRKVVLVEEFTTEKCGNCPTAAPILTGAIEKFEEEYPHSVAMICHHSAFMTDFMTTPHDEEYLYLFGGGTYAPAMMVDRHSDDGFSPVFKITTEENIVKEIEEAYNRTAQVAMEVGGYYDEPSGTLDINVAGMRRLDFSEDIPLRINVVVVENNIPAQIQNNAPEGYLHQHVMRCTNSTWGDIIEWTGDDFTYSCTLDISKEWITDNLEVIAYISKYDETNVANCSVENARKETLKSFTSVADMTDGGEQPRARYSGGNITVNSPYTVSGVWTSDGRRVSDTCVAPGLYIVKVTGKGKTFTQKMLVR